MDVWAKLDRSKRDEGSESSYIHVTGKQSIQSIGVVIR